MNVFILMCGGDYREGWHVKSVHSTEALVNEAKLKWEAQDDYGYYWVALQFDVDPPLETIPTNEVSPPPYVWDDEADEVVHATAWEIKDD